MIGLLNCVSIERQGGTAQPPTKGVITSSMPPLFPTCYGTPGWVGAGRARIAAEQQPRPDLIYLLGNIHPVTSRSPKKPQEASNISDEIHGAILR